MSDARERLTEIAYRDEARAVYVRTDDLRAVLREVADNERSAMEARTEAVEAERDRLRDRETKGAICPNTGLPCVPGCDRKTCGGLHIPLDQWPSKKGESDAG